uniref:Uncharacterized protein n=1 Tax=Rhizophora mucronata TaxID=61149 RepID=A0A2P2MH36_RHIMU
MTQISNEACKMVSPKLVDKNKAKQQKKLRVCWLLNKC